MKLPASLFLALLPVFVSSCLDQSSVAAESTPRSGPQPVAEESVIRGFDPAAPEQSLLALTQNGSATSRLVFEKTELELGEIYQFESIHFEFPFQVEGSDPVVLSRIESSCGCTDAAIRADWEMNAPGADPTVEKLYVYGQEIPPGARGTVIGTFTSERRKGTKVTHLQIFGNFAKSPTVLDIHTVIRSIFDVKPEQVKFGDVLVGATKGIAPQEVRVVCRSPFEVLQWKRLPVGIKIEQVGSPEPTGFKTEVARTFRITLADDAPEGMLSTSCIGETSIKVDLEIMVLANVIGPVNYTPPARLAFGMVPSGEERTRTIDIESSLGSVVLPAPTVELSGDASKFMAASVDTIEAGRFYRVRVTLPAQSTALSLSGVLRLNYPAGSGIQNRELLISARVVMTGPKEPK